MFDRKLHDLIDAAIIENWSIMRRHNERMAESWSKSLQVAWNPGISAGDATLASRLVNTACVRFSHPRLIEEFEQEPEPTSDQIIGFALRR